MWYLMNVASNKQLIENNMALVIKLWNLYCLKRHSKSGNSISINCGAYRIYFIIFLILPINNEEKIIVMRKKDIIKKVCL